MHEPVKWNEQKTSSLPLPTAEHNFFFSEIKHLHPFRFKKTEFLVTVTIRKIDSSWWYHACKTCLRIAKPHGDSYKCSDFECGTIGFPAQRYKLCIIAGDDTGDTDFIVFGRMAQRLIKRSADTLIGANPRGFIPDEITKLLERVFVWNVSFTENTKLSGNVCFQVNGVVGEIDSGNAIVPLTPSASQTSSIMLSPGAGSSVQGTPQKFIALPLPAVPTSSCASYGSSGAPDKVVVSDTGLPETPQSRRDGNLDGISDPQPAAGKTAVPDETANKGPNSVTGKRTRRSPNKKVSKKLVLDDEASAKDGATNLDDVAGTSPAKDA